MARLITSLASTALIGTLALGAAACGSDDGSSTGDPGGGDKAPKIAYITSTLSDYVQAEKEGAEEAAKAAGGSATIFNANFDAQKFQQQCQDAVASGRFNAIILTPISPPTGVPCVNLAKAKGIPVVNLEAPVGSSNDTIQPQVDGVVGVAIVTASGNAELQVELTKKACEGISDCKVIYEVATPSDPFTSVAKKAVSTKVPGARVVQTISGQYDPSVVASAFSDALSAHPDADVFVSTADTQALAVVPAVKRAGKLGKIKLVGNGGSRLGAAAVKDGTLFASIGTWPRQDGALAVKMAIQAVNGEEVQPNALDTHKTDAPLLLTKETVDEFKPEWGATRGN